MPPVFDPLQLTPEASLNRTIIAPLSGAERSYVGRRAYELLSMHALAQLARRHGLARTASEATVARELERALWAHEDAALTVVSVFGDRLAHLLATLTSGTRGEPEASEWRTAYLAHWAGVARVWLAGGLAAALGSSLLEASHGGDPAGSRLSNRPGAARGRADADWRCQQPPPPGSTSGRAGFRTHRRQARRGDVRASRPRET